MSTTQKSLLLISAILIVDQLLKIWVKTSLKLGDEVHVIGNWFILHFTENNGMAFGMNLPGENSKIFLSIFRIIAVLGIAFYLRYIIRKQTHKGLIISVTLILAGAIGNIIDSTFYGIIFTDSYGQIATILPEGGGYAPILHGKVVDMLYFPFIRGTLPDWFPFWAGREIIFFRPVFNIADSAITVGVFIILFFQKRFFKSTVKEKKITVDTTTT